MLQFFAIFESRNVLKFHLNNVVAGELRDLDFKKDYFTWNQRICGVSDSADHKVWKQTLSFRGSTMFHDRQMYYIFSTIF